jgi:hypothetical protein
MSKELIGKIETKISELEGKVKQNNDSIGALIASIENQSTEKTRIQTETTFISGAIQMAKAMISELQQSEPENSFQIENVEECT